MLAAAEGVYQAACRVAEGVRRRRRRRGYAGGDGLCRRGHAGGAQGAEGETRFHGKFLIPNCPLGPDG